MADNDTSSTYISSAVSIESVEDGISNNPVTPVVQIIAHNFVEASNSYSVTSNPHHTEGERDSNIANGSISHDKEINTNGTANESHSPKGYCSEENDVPSFPNKNKIQRNASLKRDALCSKLLVIFGVCFIIVSYVVPIIVYEVNQSISRAGTNLDLSQEKNISAANLELTEMCNFSASNLELDCTEEILSTYEALRTINLPSSQQYCSERVETLFCDALLKCSNESYVKEIVCQQVRQEYCTAEWRMLEMDNKTDGLIDCERYEETAPLNCGNQFDVTNDGSACLPLCEEFSQFSEAYTRPLVVVTAAATFINVIGAIIVIVISFKKRNIMFRFPQVLVVINAGHQIAIQGLQLTAVVNVATGRNILCSRRFLWDAYDNPDTICTIQGTLITSAVYTYTYFWLLYILDLALKVFYPLKSAKLAKCSHRRIIYIVEVSIVFFIGTVPPIIFAFGSNYRAIGFPPLVCGIDPEFRFYALAIPILIANVTVETIMILIIYKLHRHYGIFKKEHRESAGKQVCTCQFTIPEVKIVFVLSYWVLCTILIWTNLAIVDGRTNVVGNLLERYLNCMEGGHREGHNCDIQRLELEAESFPVLQVIFLITVAFINFASLPFVIEFQSIKKSLKKAAKKFNLAN